MIFTTETICTAGGRKVNQDYSGHKETGQAACWVVADGLGGHRGGEFASRIAVEAILKSFLANPELSADALKRHFAVAQNHILRRQEEEPGLASMRTTAVVLLTDYRSALWSHVGDSRLYHFKRDAIVFQTSDHSVPQAMVAAGDLKLNQIRFHEDRNRLLHSLGQEGEVRPTVAKAKTPIDDGDVFLLCTDGFWEYVTETAMEVDLVKSASPKEWLERMQKRVLGKARGEFDNYSAMAVFAARKR